MGVNKTVNFDDRDVADIKPSTQFGRASSSDAEGDDASEMDRVD
jgi:hypothetical protein